MILENNSTILFTGDSITDSGRSRSEGDGKSIHGNGYVHFVNLLLKSSYFMNGYEIRNTGVSGNTVRLLSERWQKDVLDHKPDYLSVMIGVNDVWRQFTNRMDQAVLIDEYEATYAELLRQAKPIVKRLILITPFLAEADRSEPMRKTIDTYADVVRKLASDNNAVLVDMQHEFDKYMDQGFPQSELAADRVHPTGAGCMIIARTVLRECGYKFV